jgi:hypothetical protein
MFNDLSPWSVMLIILVLVFLLRKINLNKLIKTQTEKEHKDITEHMQYSYREDYYKNASNQSDKIASPNQLYSFEEEMDDIVKEIFGVVGGEDKVKYLVAWGEKNLPKETMQQYEEPYKALISKLGYANISPGEKLRGNAISEDDIQKIKDALLYLESLYNN